MRSTRGLANEKLEKLVVASRGPPDPRVCARVYHALNEAVEKQPSPGDRSWMKIFSEMDSSADRQVEWFEFKTFMRKSLRIPKTEVCSVGARS